MSFKTGIFPQACKVANIIPIYKKGDKLDCSNYMPVSLLRMLEKLSNNVCMGNFANSSIKLTVFMQNTLSTNHALISITEEIRRILDNEKFTCGVFLDFQKAFDMVHHKILLTKLEYHGIRGHGSDCNKQVFKKQHLSNWK